MLGKNLGVLGSLACHIDDGLMLLWSLRFIDLLEELVEVGEEDAGNSGVEFFLFHFFFLWIRRLFLYFVFVFRIDAPAFA